MPPTEAGSSIRAGARPTKVEESMRSIDQILRIFAAGTLCAAGLSLGCAGTPVGEDTPLETEFSGAPDWVIQGCSAYWGDDGASRICGVGSAAGSRNVSLMRTTAIGRGRTEIARSLQTGVRAMLKDYGATTTGGEEFGDSANDEQHVIDVSKQITNMSLSGTEMTDSWISKNGTYYALVALDVEKFADSVSRMDQLSEQVRRAVVERADASFAELDEEIEKDNAR
jgi:hypothetical protein